MTMQVSISTEYASSGVVKQSKLNGSATDSVYK
jgi:hypothetical protein